MKSFIGNPGYSSFESSLTSSHFRAERKHLLSVPKKSFKPQEHKTFDIKLVRAMDASEPQTAKTSRKSKAWEKTKKFFASLGEPPTAEYDRQQAAKKGVKTNGREAYGAINYGPYHQGGPFGGRT